MQLQKTYLRLNWKMWEMILIVTGWLFGYGHEAYYGVKNNRNAAFFKYTFYKERVG